MGGLSCGRNLLLAGPYYALRWPLGILLRLRLVLPGRLDPFWGARLPDGLDSAGDRPPCARRCDPGSRAVVAIDPCRARGRPTGMAAPAGGRWCCRVRSCRSLGLREAWRRRPAREATKHLDRKSTRLN